MEKKLEDECDTQEKISPSGKTKQYETSDKCSQMDDIIGGFGKYQFLIFLFKVLIGATSAFNNLGVTFFAPSDFISFWCSDADSLVASASNLTPSNISYNLNSSLGYDTLKGPTFVEAPLVESYMRNQTIFREDQTDNWIRQLFGDFMFGSERKYKHSLNLNSDTPRNRRQECKYLSSSDNKYHKCSSYEYDTGIWISTIIDEWDLVCDRSWFVSVTQSLYMAGFMVAYLMFGYISDRFGRWNSLLLGAVIEISSGFGCAIATSITQFMIFRFLLGIGSAGRSSSAYLIMIEWTGMRWRLHVSTLGSLGWVAGYCLMPWIVLFFLHFRHMQLFICFYESLFFIWLLRLPESPRWLLTHRRFNEAYDVLKTAAKFNGLILRKDDHLETRCNLTTQTADNLVTKKHSITIENSMSSSYANDMSNISNGSLRIHSDQRHENLGNGHLPSIIELDNSLTKEKSRSIEENENSLLHTNKMSSSNIRNNEGIYDFLVSLCASGANLFCGEGQAKDLRPYSEDEFDLKFKHLTNFIETKELTKNEDRLSILDLFKWKNLRKYTFILAFTWAMNAFIYYGIALRIGDFGGKNLFVAFTFAGATEIPSIAFTLVCMKLLPRKTTNQFMFAAIFVLCALQVPLRYMDCQWLQQLTMMLAKLFNNCSFICILYQTMELFPTSIRQTAYSSCSLAGRIGSILAPFVKELSQMTSTLVPAVIYAVLSLVEILFIRNLPETQGVDLPDTLLEAEKFKGSDKLKKDARVVEFAERGELDKPPINGDQLKKM